MDFYEELLKARKENKTYATATVVKPRGAPRALPEAKYWFCRMAVPWALWAAVLWSGRP